MENPDRASIPQTSEEYCRERDTVGKQELAHMLQLPPVLPYKKKG